MYTVLINHKDYIYIESVVYEFFRVKYEKNILRWESNCTLVHFLKIFITCACIPD